MKDNTKTFTTGELAKICHVSVRTVQFYDNEKLVCPSELSEGGRRIYTESDVADFRLVCLYRSLGFSLKEIKKVMDSEDKYNVICGLLDKQKQKIEEQIEALSESKEKLLTLQDTINKQDITAISSEDDLNRCFIGQKRHYKTDVMTYIFMACYVLVLLAGFPLSVSIGGFSPYIMLLIAVILLVGLIYYHSSANAYICPNCHKKFAIGFLKDMMTLNGGKKGKLLKCPYCKRREWISETFRDE